MNEKKMLVVDDETYLLAMLEELFSDAGYCVFTAENAEDALKILQKNSIMVMLLDLNLPGMSGIELCRQIRKENQIGLIHALTGYANFYGLLECRAAGFDDFFLKPVDVDVLLQIAQESFDRLSRWDVYKYDLT